MALNTFFEVNMPYCLKNLGGGKFVVLNREYKPLGFRTRANVTYEDHPIVERLKGLTEKVINQVACKGSARGLFIHLYDDACVPTRSKRFMDEYLHRLSILAKLTYPPIARPPHGPESV